MNAFAAINSGRCFFRRLVVLESLLALWAVDLHIRWIRISKAGRQKKGCKARYLKEVDAAERTLRFWQVIYDSHDRISESHEKFPVDRGHQPMEDSQQ
jgi:hypothetical protein